MSYLADVLPYGLAVLLGIVAVFFLIRTKPKGQRCRECGEGRLELLQKEPLDLITGNHEGYGSYSTASVLYRKTYRCTNCGERWVVTQTETG